MTTRSLAPALALALPLLGMLPAVARADAASLFYERSLMSAAGARCKLFDTSTSAALAASARQARGAALRSGADAFALDEVADRAQLKAAATGCASPDLAVVAARVRAAFTGYAGLKTMSFPGGVAAWRADRGTGAAGWRLSQAGATRPGRAILGLAADDQGSESFAAVAGWPTALGASTARLVMRDPTLAPRAYLDPRHPELARQTPPRVVTQAFFANARASASPALLPSGAAAGALFRFPPAAVAALEGLDPRETVMLELVYPTRDGERVEATPFEVGDFAAGRAFLSARKATPSAPPRPPPG